MIPQAENKGVYVAHGCDDMVRLWVSRELGMEIQGAVKCMGIMRGEQLVGGVVLHNYKGHMVECTFATINNRWCTRDGLKQFFDYIFNQLGCVRVHGLCARKNKKMRKLFTGLGFKYEGCHKKAFDGVRDAMSYAMLKNECRWI